MVATRLQILLTKSNRSQIYFWLGLSLLMAIIYSYPALQEAFKSEYRIQDDARQHVFWMRRFLDPELFPQDIMADYFQSVAPWGYSTLYRIFASIGVDPVFFSKILPLILGLIITGFCFGVGMQLLPLPIAGFVTATLLNQNLWMRDDLSSATPGAFYYPIFVAFLYFLLRRSLIPCLITILLQGLFYPQAIFVSAAVLLLRLLNWRNRQLCLTADREQLRLSASGLGVAAAVLLLYAAKTSQFGAVITAAEARSMPAFAATGWSAYFSDRWVDFWVCGKRSGMFPTEWCALTMDDQNISHWWLALKRFPSLWLGLLFPIVLSLSRFFPLVAQLRNWSVLFQVLLSSIFMFLTAHLFAFKLHLPNRYTEHSFRILLALAAGMTLVVLWNTLSRWCLRYDRWGRSFLVGLTIVGLAGLSFYPYRLEIDHDPFPVTDFIRGEPTGLYRFFAKQPKDIKIASITKEANLVPTFSQRSLFVGGEGFILPYHPLYFQQVSTRLLDLIKAQYSLDLRILKQFIRQNDIDFWLLNSESFQPDFNNSKSYLRSVFEQFPVETQPIKAQLMAGTPAALSQVAASCRAFEEEDLQILKAKCILKQ